MSLCEQKWRWTFTETVSTDEFYYRLLFYVGCFVSKWAFVVVAVGLPEMILYPLTFRHIIMTTNATAAAQILRPGANPINFFVPDLRSVCCWQAFPA
jgi:hypothetical protein